MCRLRPGELAGLRWAKVDIDGDEPRIYVHERANEVNKRYVGQAPPKTPRKAAIGLHPLVVAALQRHRSEMQLVSLYDPEGFVLCTRNRTPISLSNLRNAFRRLCVRERSGATGPHIARQVAVAVFTVRVGVGGVAAPKGWSLRQAGRRTVQPTQLERREPVSSTSFVATLRLISKHPAFVHHVWYASSVEYASPRLARMRRP